MNEQVEADRGERRMWELMVGPSLEHWVADEWWRGGRIRCRARLGRKLAAICTVVGVAVQRRSEIESWKS